MQVPNGSCANTDSIKNRGNITLETLSFKNVKTYKIIHSIVGVRYLGLWDIDGILHPIPNSTQWSNELKSPVLFFKAERIDHCKHAPQLICKKYRKFDIANAWQVLQAIMKLIISIGQEWSKLGIQK
jgi:hypothetical protein